MVQLFQAYIGLLLFLQLLVVLKMVGFQVILEYHCLDLANWTKPLQVFSGMHLGYVDAQVKLVVRFVITNVTVKVFYLPVYLLDMPFQTVGV